MLVHICVEFCANCLTSIMCKLDLLLKVNYVLLTAKSYIVLQVLLGPMGLKSANPLEQQAAILSLCNLMSIIPGDTYLEFEKVDMLFIYVSSDHNSAGFCNLSSL